MPIKTQTRAEDVLFEVTQSTAQGASALFVHVSIYVNV